MSVASKDERETYQIFSAIVEDPLSASELSASDTRANKHRRMTGTEKNNECEREVMKVFSSSLWPILIYGLVKIEIGVDRLSKHEHLLSFHAAR